MKFENPTMTISKFEVENVLTVSMVGNVDQAVDNFIADNGGGTSGAAGIKIVF